MSAIHRRIRDFLPGRPGELLGGLSPVRERPWEPSPSEPLPSLRSRQPFQDGFEAVSQLLTSRDFQQRLHETLAGTSPRAVQVRQVASTYQSFWKDSQDFAVRKGPSLSVPEPPRYVAPAETAWKGRALTVPEFQASPVAAARTSAFVTRARHASHGVPPAFSLLGLAALRG